MTIGRLSLLAAGALVLGPGCAYTASHRIVCDGPYQVINGHAMETPYCVDANLAKVANSYGMRVSAEAIRSNPSVKASACRLVGYDNRVQSACASYRNQNRNEPF